MVDAEAAAEAEELTDEQKEMMSVMGFSDFTSSKVRVLSTRCGSLTARTKNCFNCCESVHR